MSIFGGLLAAFVWVVDRFCGHYGNLVARELSCRESETHSFA